MNSYKVTNVAFTRFNYDDTTVEKFKSFIINNCKYGIFGEEICPRTNNKHLQGFMSLSQSQRASYLKRFDKEMHFEPMHKFSSAEHNEKYCKKDGKYWSHGEIKSVGQGARTDLKTKLDLYSSARDFCLSDPETYSKYRNGIKDYYTYKDEELLNEYKPVKVTYIHGWTGIGKTRGVFEKHGPKNVCKINYGQRERTVFDNYKGQNVLLLDEFRGNMPLCALLDILDNYYTLLPCRYNDKVWKYTEVYITSNCPLETLYPHIDLKSYDALKRRIDEIIYVN